MVREGFIGLLDRLYEAGPGVVGSLKDHVREDRGDPPALAD